jgi:hypothetical protein
MLVVHGSAFAVAAVASAPSDTETTHTSELHDACAILFGTRALLRLYSTHFIS